MSEGWFSQVVAYLLSLQRFFSCDKDGNRIHRVLDGEIYE